MDLSNTFESVVHYRLIERMTDFSYWDRVSIVSALLCMVHLLNMTYGKSWQWLSGSHDITKMLHHMVFQPWENIELVLKSVVTLTYR